MTTTRLRRSPIPGVRDSYTGVDFNLGFHVRHYELTLDYRVGPNRLSGTAVLTIENYQPLRSLTLDRPGVLIPAHTGKAAGVFRTEHSRGPGVLPHHQICGHSPADPHRLG